MEHPVKMNRELFFGNLAKRLSVEDLREIQVMYQLAKSFHRNQVRDVSAERYFEHLRAVAWILIYQREIYDRDAIIVALGHDLPEDTDVPNGLIFKLFGPEVDLDISLLSKVTLGYDPITGRITRTKKDPEVYFGDIERLGINAPIVKLSDRYHNLRTFGGFDRDRVMRKIAETEQYIIPMAERRDPWFAEKIKEQIVALRATVS